MTTISTSTPVAPVRPPAKTRSASPGVRVVHSLLWTALAGAVTTGLHYIPQRSDVAPSIVGDNAYIFLAADRLYEGDGATCIPPKAPFQPWSWQADWAFLTQWPVGYPALICAVRMVTQTTSASAGVSIAMVCCGLGMVAWFAWLLRCLGTRLTGIAIALTVAVGAFSVDALVNPASDTIVLAALPLALILAARVLRFGQTNDAPCHPSGLGLIQLGLTAGALFWIRYAAAFVPFGVGLYVLWSWAVGRRLTFRHVVVYGVSALTPIAALIAVNHFLGAANSVQEKLNLGVSTALTFDSQIASDIWNNFTRQSLYAHRPEAYGFFAAILPIAAWLLPLTTRDSRKSLASFLRKPSVQLSVAMIVSMFALLTAATIFFRGKYNYAQLDRYYVAIRPFYWLVFVGPLAAMPQTTVRIGVVALMLAFGGWFVQQDHMRAFDRIAAKQQKTTNYGRWAERFEPHSRSLYSWLAAQSGDGLVVFSNFQDDIALETRIPACPVPESLEEMDQWVAKIKKARGVDSVRILFVLEPTNPHRDYFQASASQVVANFDLHPYQEAPPAIQRYVFTFDEMRIVLR